MSDKKDDVIKRKVKFYGARRIGQPDDPPPKQKNKKKNE